MEKGNTIKAIFFDVGGVCLTNGWDENSREAAARKFSLDFQKTENRHDALFQDLERGDLTLENYIDSVYFVGENNFGREDILSFMKEQSKAIDSTFEVLKDLKKLGKYRLATINNESFVLNVFRIQKFGLRDYFDDFFSSAFLHMRKPEGRIFRTVLHITGLDPHDCLFIDDREENIEAAAFEGFECIHLPEPAELRTKLKKYDILN